MLNKRFIAMFTLLVAFAFTLKTYNAEIIRRPTVVTAMKEKTEKRWGDEEGKGKRRRD
jgi:hypothetical protein